MSTPELRNRKPVSSDDDGDTTKKRRAAAADDDENEPLVSFVDMLRVLSGIILLSCIFSWFVTDGESLTWGYRPRFTRWDVLKTYFKPELHFTPDELLRYNGEDPTLPIYVAVNGSVFDVSANSHTYGPGGPYHFFSGRDASRAYVSGCFKDDLTYDTRGLERMFVAGKDKEEDEAQLAEINRLEALKREGRLHEAGRGGEYAEATGEGRLRWLKSRREKRWREARERVDKGVAHWVDFFGKHEKYFYVGTVDNPSLEGKPIRELCDKTNKKPKEKKPKKREDIKKPSTKEAKKND